MHDILYHCGGEESFLYARDLRQIIDIFLASVSSLVGRGVLIKPIQSLKSDTRWDTTRL